MKITKQRLQQIIQEEVNSHKASLGELDLPDRGFDAKQWDYARTQLDAKMKSVLQDKESQVLNIDDEKIMRIIRGLDNVIGSNPSIAEELTKAEKSRKKELEKELDDLKHK